MNFGRILSLVIMTAMALALLSCAGAPASEAPPAPRAAATESAEPAPATSTPVSVQTTAAAAVEKPAATSAPVATAAPAPTNTAAPEPTPTQASEPTATTPPTAMPHDSLITTSRDMDTFQGKALEAYAKAQSLRDQGHYLEAIQAYKDARKHHPEPSYVLENRLGHLYRLLELHDEAIKHFSNSLDIKPNNPTEYLSRSHVYLNKGQCDLAINDANFVIALKAQQAPNFNSQAEAHLNLSKCYEYREDYTKARHHLDQAIAIATTSDYNQDSLNLLVQIRKQVGQGEIFLRPTAKLVEKATKLTESENHKVAAATLKKAREVHGRPSYYIEHETGNSYLMDGDYESAINHYSTALTIKNDPVTRISRSEAYLETDQCHLAIQDAEQVLSLEPVNEPAYNTHIESHTILAYCHLQVTDRKTSEKHFDNAIKIANESKQDHSYISSITNFRANLLGQHP